MAITYVASSALGAVAASPPSISLVLPTLQADDIILIHVMSKNIVLPANEIDTPSGYTEVGTKLTIDSGTAADDMRAAMFYKRAVAGDSGATVVVSRAGTSTLGLYAVAHVFRGAITTGDPFDTAGIVRQGDITADDLAQFPAFDPVATDVHAIYFTWHADDLSTPPASFTNDGTTFTLRNEAETGVGSDATQAIYSADRTGNPLAAIAVDLVATAGSDISYAYALRPQTQGTTFPQSFAGSVTPTGTGPHEPQKPLSGGVTPAGTGPHDVLKLVAGGMAPTGGLLKQLERLFGGSMTPAGALATLKVVLRAFAGAVAPSGALRALMDKALGGGFSPIGALQRIAGKPLTGESVPTGLVVRQTAKALMGSVMPAGLYARAATFARAFAGSVLPIGVLVRRIDRLVAGILAPIGTFASSVIGGNYQLRVVQEVDTASAALGRDADAERELDVVEYDTHSYGN